MLKKVVGYIDPLFAILLVATVLRFWHLGYPNNATFDELHYVPAGKILVGITPHPGLQAWHAYPLITLSPDINFSHPPLGKFIIGGGILLFGDTGLGWRFFSALFGVLSLCVFYRICRKLLNNVHAATFAVFLLSFDFLHILQSRLAMLDVFLMFFILVAVWALVELVDKPMSKLWLFLGALAIALSVSIKYVGALGAIQAFALFFILSSASLKTKIKTTGIVGVGSFAIYSLWAIYYFQHGYSYIDWLRYHLAVSAETLGPLSPHTYGSAPIQWLINSKAILYHFSRLDGEVSVIYALGNPIIWTAFLISSYLVFANYWMKREKLDLAIMVWFLITYVPLIFILWRRQGFIYHMLPSVPVMCLMVTRALYVNFETKKKIVYGFAGAVVLAAIIGFPIMTGTFFPQSIYNYFWR